MSTTGAGEAQVGFVDPEDEAPWAMQLAFVVDKQSPATVTAICEAAAKAVVTLLSDDRSVSGEWRPYVERWTDGKIRKVVRRGKPAQFDRAEAVPGITLEHSGAKVRAFVPGSTAEVPADVKRLQVSGSEPPELGLPSEDVPVALVLNPNLEMSVGKKAAQVGHAAQLAWLGMPADARSAWEAAGFPLRVVHPGTDEWELLLPQARERVVDAGFTEIPAGSNTVIALY